MDLDTKIFYKRMYEDEHYSTLPKGYPLPSLSFIHWRWRSLFLFGDCFGTDCLL